MFPLLSHLLLLFLLPPPTSSSSPTFLFGNGCFWHNQHLFTKFEQDILGRDILNLTSTAGYAAGKEEPTPLCYPSSTNYNNHEQYGSAEAVSLHLSNLKDFALAAKLFFSDFQRIGVNVWARKDVYDQGPQFRALIGVPGGLNGDYGPLIEDANLHGMELLDGEGSDEDTFEDNAVYVYDTGEGEKGTFQQAEVCLQYHEDNNDPPYDDDYKAIKQMRLDAGTLKEIFCPPNDFIPTCA